jgi:3-phenylpropionate/cinnamic acid dioxygenase small subunit
MSIETLPVRASDQRPVAFGPQLQWEIEQFLYAEAHLLDTRRYEEWLELLTADIRYVMRVVTDRIRRDAIRFKPQAIELKHFDDGRENLEHRVQRIRSGMAWSDDPPVRGTHYVANVRVSAGDTAQELRVSSNFLVHVSRTDEPATVFSGARDDVLRAADAGWRIASRTISLDESVLNSTNLTFFF